LLCLGSFNAGAQVKPDITAADPSPSMSKALKLYERIAGVKAPVDLPAIKTMADLIAQGNILGAADVAMTDPNFFNITIKQMALKTSTRDENIKTPFNDFTAFWIGLVRDDLDARQLLTGNFYYMADATKIPTGVTIRSDVLADVVTSNNHYADLEAKNLDYSAVLKRVDGQVLSAGTAVPGTLAANPDPAGIITSRSFLTNHVIAGTNRRAIEYTFREFMCIPIGQWSDTGAPDLRIGPDIDRYPGGDHQKFETTCKGCHTQMDSFRGAFAYWDTDTNGNKAVYTGTPVVGTATVASKYARNNTVFPDGFKVVDNSFINNSNRATNAETFGWRGTNISYGNGVGQFATMVSNSKRFSECMTRRVFEAACKRDFNIQTNITIIKKYAPIFESQGYSFKKLFRTVATSPECIGE
jgi:hypothetical protein